MSTILLNEAERALADVWRDGHLDSNTSTITWDNIVVAAGSCLAATIAAAVPGYLFLAGNVVLYLLLLGGLLAAGIYMARKSPVSAGLALGYSVVLGLVAGAFTSAAVTAGGSFSLVYEALLGTTAGSVGVVLLSVTPIGKRLGQGGKLFVSAMVGYLLLGIVNIIAALMGVGDGWGLYGVGLFGVVLSLIGVLFAAWSLLTAFTSAAKAIDLGAPSTWSWSLGMGVASSIVWMYLEILRLLSVMNR